jgi:hypothetical protein
LQRAVTQDQSVEKRGTRMQTDEGNERLRAELVSLREQAVDFRVWPQQRRYLPDEQFKGPTAKQAPEETCRRLQQNQGVKAKFIGLCERLLPAST